jgi:WD40 repeat protein
MEIRKSAAAAMTTAATILLAVFSQNRSAESQMPGFALETEFAVAQTDPEVQRLAWSPDGSAVAALAPVLRYAKVFAVPSGQEVGAISDLVGAGKAIEFTSDGRVVIPARRSGPLAFTVWNPKTGECSDIGGPDPSGTVNTNRMFAFQFDRSRKVLAGLHNVRPELREAARTSVFDASTWRLGADYRLAATVLSISPDGQRVATDGADGEFVITETSTGSTVRRVRTGGETGVRELAWSPDGRLIASGTLSSGFGFNPGKGAYGKLHDDKVIRVWNSETGELIAATQQPLGGGVESIDFSPDGLSLLSTTLDGTLRLWDAKTLQQRQLVAENLHPNTARARFSPDGRRIAVARTGLGRINIYRLQ